MPLSAFLLLTDTAENRTLCRARALGKRVSVFSPRARTPAGGRSRCGFAKRTRGFSAQCLSPISMRCRLSFSCPFPCPNANFIPRRIELCAGRGSKENVAATQGGTHFPNGGLGGNPIPEYRRDCGQKVGPLRSGTESAWHTVGEWWRGPGRFAAPGSPSWR